MLARTSSKTPVYGSADDHKSLRSLIAMSLYMRTEATRLKQPLLDFLLRMAETEARRLSRELAPPAD
jgi:hypothetical protein